VGVLWGALCRLVWIAGSGCEYRLVMRAGVYSWCFFGCVGFMGGVVIEGGVWSWVVFCGRGVCAV